MAELRSMDMGGSCNESRCTSYFSKSIQSWLFSVLTPTIFYFVLCSTRTALDGYFVSRKNRCETDDGPRETSYFLICTDSNPSSKEIPALIPLLSPLVLLHLTRSPI
jgi:hypothetical protein